MYSISIFYFKFYLFGWGAYASNAPPAYGPAIRNDVSATTVSVIFHSKD